jgi:molybdopterin-containing oxidoreductase family membrane subunit
MVLSLIIPFRKWFHMEDLVTMRHIEACAKLMLGTGLIVAYGYSMEAFIAYYSGNGYERFMYLNRMFGPYAITYWLLLTCNIFVPQLLWIRSIRLNVTAVWLLSLVVQTGMWLERFVIVITSLHRDFLPSSWGMYYPTVWDLLTLFGTCGFFLFLMILFVRTLPAISIFEEREEVHRKAAHAH